MDKKTELIGILADTHENLPMIRKAVQLFNQRKVGSVLHAGDFISPITANEFKKLEAPLTGVFGNNDGDRLFLRKRFCEEGIGEIKRDPYEFTYKGQHVFLMHQPKFLETFVEQGYPGVYIYGHTHEIDVREGSPFIINPGECGGWLTGKSTIALLDICNMKVEIIDLD